MSTDHNNEWGIEEILDNVGLKDIKLHDCDITQLVSNVYNNVKLIWLNNDLPNFPDHGINHSIRIIKNFLELDNLYKWSDFEKVIIVISALIHDIGMQYNSWANQRFNENPHSDFPAPPLKNDDIRKKHCMLGFQLIKHQLLNDYPYTYPPNFFTSRSGDLQIIGYAYTIAFSHSDIDILNTLIIDEANFKEKLVQSYQYRPRLIAGTFRLCDELDGNYERLINPNEINRWEINKISKYHWYACLFVEGYEYQIDQQSIRIIIRWRVPKDIENNFIPLIKTFITNWRESKINDEINKIKEFYEACDDLKYIRPIKTKLNSNPSDLYLPYTVDFNLIKEAILYYRDQPNDADLELKISNPEIIIQESGEVEVNEEIHPESGEVEAKEEIHPESGEVEVKEEIHLESNENENNSEELIISLLDWYDNNKETGHFELLNKNEHTDTYLCCRSLVSNQLLLRKIAGNVYSTYKNQKIHCVLAVGTSAIPIAVNVAYKLKCIVTYTFAREKTQQINIENNIKSVSINEALKRDYYLNEIIPIINNDQNILIIDDVISGGNVAQEILDLITDVLKIIPGKIFHQTIFRLGDREYIRDKRICDYNHIIHIASILYATSDNCPLCRRNISLTKEVDMY